MLKTNIKNHVSVQFTIGAESTVVFSNTKLTSTQPLAWK